MAKPNVNSTRVLVSLQHELVFAQAERREGPEL